MRPRKHTLEIEAVYSVYTLFITIRKKPQKLPEQIYPLNSYPGLLLDEVHRFKNLVTSSLNQILKEIQRDPPQLLVFMGEHELTQAWKELFEHAFPRLFIYTSDVQDPFAILSALNPRFQTLRLKRLNGPAKAYRATGGDIATLFADNPQRETLLTQAQTMIETYELEGLWDYLGIEAFERILYCLALLEGVLAPHLKPVPQRQVLDVGTHIWSYAPALKAFFDLHSEKLALTGLELDGQFLNEGGCLRRDLAAYYAQLSQGQFREGSLLEFTQKQDIICHFLPIILPQNAVLWQISARDYQPVLLIKHSYDLLTPGGFCLLYNGVELEYQAMLKMIQNAGLAPFDTGRWNCPLRGSEQGFFTLLKK